MGPGKPSDADSTVAEPPGMIQAKGKKQNHQLAWRVQASIFKPADRIDTEDLPAGLPRKEVQGYSWTDSGFQICITAPLEEAVARPQVQACQTQVQLKQIEIVHFAWRL